MVRDRSNRGRLVWGIVLLVAGACFLALNLGFRIPRELWDYWPILLIVLGVAQVSIPGASRDRLGGFWLIAVGIYGWVSQFELFGLHWGTAWPILLVFLGIRMVLGSLLRGRPRDPNSTPGSQS